MTSLADFISIDRHYTRSANLERDTGGDVLDGYILTGRAVETVRRIVAALASGTGGAWSVTGPYGSGKSSLGVFLASLFGDPGSPQQQLALDRIVSVDPDLAEDVRQVVDHFGNQTFLDGLVTAQSEPITHTITRALQRATLAAFGKTPTARTFPEIKLLHAALADIGSDDPRRTGPSPASLLEIARALASRAPLLIVVDEFGKNLEAAQQRPDADLYLLQLLAEAAQTRRGAPIALLTMQHLAFGDYAATADTAQQREWAKIQGRFDDVVFVDAPAQTQQLIAGVFDHGRLHRRVQTWAAKQAQEMRRVQLFDIADAELIANCYPLHPTVLAVLPELCRRYGQNERSLFGFLAGSDGHAVPQLLMDRHVPSRGPLPTINLVDAYNYFATASNTATARTSRWSEIVVKLRDIAGLPAHQIYMAKAIAVLNLVGSNGPLRARADLLAATEIGDEGTIQGLLTADVVVHRKSTDEYRVWHGSDVDLEAQLAATRERATNMEPHAVLAASCPLGPAVAAGHSMRTDTLRTFERSYLCSDGHIADLPANSPFDGRCYLAVRSTATEQDLRPTRPICVHQPDNVDDLVEAARAVHAHDLALDIDDIANDWVARNEIRERRADAERALHDLLDDAWNSGVTTLLTSEGSFELESTGSAALSEAADAVYREWIPIRNETLNRVEMTSTGAKARRLLLLAMLGNEQTEQLGLEGNGPEVAMYRSVLAASGIHSLNRRTGRWEIRQPNNADYKPAWNGIVEEFKSASDRRINVADIYATLQLPPIGMKPGPIPVIVHAALIATSDEVALYEHGTFKPALTADVSDRLVRNPGHFEVKHFANARAGSRRSVVEKLAERLGIRARFGKSRVSNVLAVVGALVNTVSQLPPITLRATDLAEETIAVRDAIVSATEPDELLFVDLPAAVGFDPVRARSREWRHLDDFVDHLVAALEELDHHFAATLDRLLRDVFAAAAEPGREQLAGQAAAIVEEVLDPELRTFALALADRSFDDAHWIENLATNVTRTAVRHWDSNQYGRFRVELAGKLAAFRRIQILHHESRAIEGKPFRAQRITRTRPTGEEEALLVALDDSDRFRLETPWQRLVDSIADRYGSRAEAEKVALGYAAEVVLGPLTAADEPSRPDIAPKVVAHDD